VGQKSISDINIGDGFLADSQPHLNIFARRRGGEEAAGEAEGGYKL
jgi:hypothetical protein